VHQVRVYGKAYGITRAGGLSFADDPYKVTLADFKFRAREPFVYEYDMGDFWQHDIRIERVLPRDRSKRSLVCIGGAGDCPRKTAAVPQATGTCLQNAPPGRRWSKHTRICSSSRSGCLPSLKVGCGRRRRMPRSWTPWSECTSDWPGMV